MKRRHMFLTMMMTLLLLLISVSAWAMLPEDGIYEKKDESGNVTARMFIITLDGKASETQEGRSMKTSAGAPIIALQALDGSGNVTEELATCYIWKTDTAGAGETGLRLRGEALQNAMKQHSRFTPEVFSTSFGQQVEFGFVNEGVQNAMKQYSKFTPEVFSTSFGQQVEIGFVNEGEANAYNCSDALNGKYVKKADATEYYPVSALLYAYEKTLNHNAFQNKNISPNSYTRKDEEQGEPWHGDYYVLNVSNPDRQDVWTVTADKNLHIVMENHQHNYYFLFVKKDYNAEPSWVGITWSNFTGTAMTRRAFLGWNYLEQFHRNGYDQHQRIVLTSPHYPERSGDAGKSRYVYPYDGFLQRRRTQCDYYE